MTTYTAKDLAEMLKGTLKGDENRTVCGVSSLKEADENQVSFLGNKKYHHQLASSKAGIVLLSKDVENEELPSDKTYIVCDNVDLCFSKVIGLFAPPPPVYERTIHPTAAVDPTAVIGKNVHIGANAVIDRNAVIGDDSCICAGSYIGQEAKVGCGTLIYPNVSLLHRCIVGNKCIIHSGAVIGADGFGFMPGPQGIVKIPQTGIVQIDDDVEIGANTTVDRARFGKTWIKSKVKIDNLVVVAHNVVINESSMMIAQSGIAGSSELGRGVIIAAQAGINGHIKIGDGSKVAGTSGVAKSIEPNSIVIGTPAESQREFMARLMLPKKVERLQAKIDALTAEIEKLKAAVEQ